VSGDIVDVGRPVVAHATSVHPADDNRIHRRQCASLAAAGFDVRLVVLGPEPADPSPGVTPVSAGPRQSRLARMTVGAVRMLLAIRAQRPQVVHLHDPELMVLVPLLAAMRYRIVVDLHEDPTLQIQDKDFPPSVKRASIAAYRVVLGACRPFVDRFVVAWPHPKPPGPVDRVVEIHNYPSADEFAAADRVAVEDRERLAVSVGSNGRNRALFEMIEAAERLGDDGVVEVVGAVMPADLLADRAEWVERSGVRLPGRVGHAGVTDALGRARIGLCLLYPTAQYTLAEPTKLFEYLMVGLPIVGADMGPTAEIVQRHQCGLLVDPKDPAAIAEAIRTLLDDEELAVEFGRRSKLASANYTWEAQAERLVAIYQTLVETALDE
jgi:glycosyltransferase involved in cell wall biosynthesis